MSTYFRTRHFEKIISFIFCRLTDTLLIGNPMICFYFHSRNGFSDSIAVKGNVHENVVQAILAFKVFSKVESKFNHVPCVRFCVSVFNHQPISANSSRLKFYRNTIFKAILGDICESINYPPPVPGTHFLDKALVFRAYLFFFYFRKFNS